MSLRLAAPLGSLVAAAFLALPTHAQVPDLARYPLVPWPHQVEPRPGAFTLNAETRLRVSGPDADAAAAAAERWAHPVRVATGFGLRAEAGADLAAEATDNTVAFIVDPALDTGPEGYRLDVSDTRVVVRSGTAAGLFYGAQTLRQLSPAAVERGGILADGPPEGWTIPAVSIEDHPRFGWRGLHLDVGRHFFDVAFVKRYLDLMASFKFNRFHWHLTEDQGWRIEIQAYPRLTEVGAWRDGTLVGHYGNRPHTFDGRRYGGFYTQDEIREIVAYAAERHITVVPEIELPGHSSAALAAYPEFGCGEGPVEVAQLWGVFEDIYCPREETFAFLETVLDEVMDLFPGPWIHIGGDEAPKAQWERSPLAQEVMQREGLADEQELQSWFIRRIEGHLNAAGRRLIGWDEIVEGGLSPTATLMFWRDWNQEALALAARQGNDIVMTPNSVMYFDHYQGDPVGEPVAIGGRTTLQDVYAYDPVPESFGADAAQRILGAQANLWTEYIDTPQKAEYMAYPRAVALAEVVWSAPGDRNWFSFLGRLPAILERLALKGVRYRPPGGRGPGDMPRVLLVSYHFPPSSAVGALRPGRWARLLPDFGFDVEVICGRLSPDGGEVDASRGDLVPGSTAVHPVQAPRTATLAVPGEGRIRERARRMARDNFAWWFLTRDWSWRWGTRAARRAGELLEGGTFDLVVTDGPPFPGMVPILRVAARKGVPAVLDLRDLWMAAEAPVPPWRGLRPHARRTAWNRRLRAEAVGIADHVVLTTHDLVEFMRRRFDSFDPGRFSCVPNAYVAVDSPDSLPPLTLGGRLRMVHTGSLAYGRSDQAEVLIRGVGRLRARGLPEVELVFVGGRDGSLTRTARECGVEDLVELRGWQEADAAEKLQRAAHALLLFQPPGRLDTELAIPAKLFDYMARRRNVFAMAGDGPVTRLVGEYDLGVTLRSEAPDDVVEAIQAIRRRVEERPVLPPPPEEFDERRTASAFADVLDRVLTKRR